MTYKVGDIVSIEFPFSDIQKNKRRPGVVLLHDESDLLIARLTTHPPRDEFDLSLNHWIESGLPRASTVRLTKLATIDHRLVHHRIGRLQDEDAAALANIWQRMSEGIVTELLHT